MEEGTHILNQRRSNKHKLAATRLKPPESNNRSIIQMNKTVLKQLYSTAQNSNDKKSSFTPLLLLNFRLWWLVV
jgi:hypothetical protein